MPIYVTRVQCDKLLDEGFGKQCAFQSKHIVFFLKPYPLMAALKNLVTGSNLLLWFAALPLRTKLQPS